MVVESAVSACERCPLGVERAVASRGPVPARVLFLSGAPRYHEERECSAFASPAFGVLEQTLSDAGIDPTGVHYATLTGCRPPGQRPVRDEEISACGPRLDLAIKAVAPEVIVLCGPEAVSAMLPGVTLSRGHGVVVKRGRRRYFPMRHPYAALHSDGYVDEVVTDLRRLASLLARGFGDDDGALAPTTEGPASGRAQGATEGTGDGAVVAPGVAPGEANPSQAVPFTGTGASASGQPVSGSATSGQIGFGYEAPAAASVPGRDTAPAAASAPGLDTARAAASAPGLDPALAAPSAPGLTTAPSSDLATAPTTPGADVPEPSAPEPGGSAPDEPAAPEPDAAAQSRALTPALASPGDDAPAGDDEPTDPGGAAQLSLF